MFRPRLFALLLSRGVFANMISISINKQINRAAKIVTLFMVQLKREWNAVHAVYAVYAVRDQQDHEHVSDLYLFLICTWLDIYHFPISRDVFIYLYYQNDNTKRKIIIILLF